MDGDKDNDQDEDAERADRKKSDDSDNDSEGDGGREQSKEQAGKQDSKQDEGDPPTEWPCAFRNCRINGGVIKLNAQEVKAGKKHPQYKCGICGKYLHGAICGQVQPARDGDSYCHSCPRPEA